MEIGRRIRNLRKSHNLTQDQLVDGLFDRSYLSQIETGKIIPPLATIRLLSERLGVPINEIIPDDFDYHKMAIINKSLIEMAAKTNDKQIVKQAWEVSHQLGSLENMFKCIKTWYKLSDLDSDYIHSLFATVNLGMTQEPFCAEYWEVLLLLANTYFHKKMYEEAADEYKRLLSLHPPVPIQYRALVNLGSTWLELHNYGEAHLAFSEALVYSVKQDVILGRIHQGLGISSRQLNLPQEAVSHTRIASEIFLNNHDLIRYNYTKVNMAVCFLDMGNLKDAHTLLQNSFDFCDKYNDMVALSKISEEFARYYFYIQEYECTMNWSNVGLDFVESNGSTTSRLLAWKVFSYVKMNNISNAVECMRHLKAIKGDSFQQILTNVDPNMSDEFRRDINKVVGVLNSDISLLRRMRGVKFEASQT